MDKKIRLGDLLVQQGILTQTQLNQAIEEQKKTGLKLGQILVSSKFISEDTLLNLLSKQLEIPVFDLSNYKLDHQLTKLLPEAYARRFRAIVLKRQGDGLLVGMVDPLDITAIDELNRILSLPIQLALVREAPLLRALDLIYRRTEEISHLAGELYEELAGQRVSFIDLTSGVKQIDAPVTRLLQSLFEDAVQVRASDIHIEPDENVLRIRLRIDGVLHEQIVQEKNIASALALRLKLISNLNIAEKRLPQDGRFNIKVRDRIIDVRLSTLPTQYGESVVMRLLDQSQGILHFEEIGMPDDILAHFRKLLRLPNGLILVTGPTGSGKTTTLYAALNELNDVTKKIITVEDPVEYRLPRINQIQVNPALDLTFARVLRTTLRQDPNIILIGEIRDQETASIAMRAALTGHLVLSTLHTNDSASSAIRLIDMNVEGFLVAATLRGILAQRLIRRVCDGCKTDYTPTPLESRWLEAISGTNSNQEHFVYGKGCAFCNNTGYKGRIGIFELLELTPEMADALRKNDPSLFSRLAATALKGQLLLDKGLALARAGISTISEAIRVAGTTD